MQDRLSKEMDAQSNDPAAAQKKKKQMTGASDGREAQRRTMRCPFDGRRTIVSRPTGRNLLPGASLYSMAGYRCRGRTWS